MPIHQAIIDRHRSRWSGPDPQDRFMQTGQARHRRLGQTGEMRCQGRLGWSNPGHATTIVAEASDWQGYLLSPDPHLAQAKCLTRASSGVDGCLNSGFLYFSLPHTRPVPVNSWPCTTSAPVPGWAGEKLVLTELEGRFRDACFNSTPTQLQLQLQLEDTTSTPTRGHAKQYWIQLEDMQSSIQLFNSRTCKAVLTQPVGFGCGSSQEIRP
jgi:hypothetical protein